MKKSFLKSLTILLVLSMAMTILVLPSCKSVSSVEEFRNLGVQEFRSIDTIYRHDSVYIRESIRGDTVYLTHTEYRDRWRIREVHDTIHNTQYITQTIEHPPERYIPPFYKRCTLFFWLILVTSALYMVGKFYLKRRL